MYLLCIQLNTHKLLEVNSHSKDVLCSTFFDVKSQMLSRQSALRAWLVLHSSTKGYMFVHVLGM